MIRLSVVIPAIRTEIAADQAAASVLKQADPVGTEVIVVSRAGGQRTRAFLESRFEREARIGTLRFASSPANALAAMLNAGVREARGNLIGFLDPDDRWLYGRIIELWPLLEDFDLCLSPEQGHARSDDWLGEYLKGNRGSLSSAIVRRSLFEAAEGFDEASPSPEYGLWLRCLSLLETSGRRRRFLALPTHNLALAREPKGQRRREARTLLRQVPRLPKGYRAGALLSSFSKFLSFM